MAGHRNASHAELSPEREPRRNCRREASPIFMVMADSRLFWPGVSLFYFRSLIPATSAPFKHSGLNGRITGNPEVIQLSLFVAKPSMCPASFRAGFHLY